jgi:uncharacterized damage-inducible protein DinB
MRQILLSIESEYRRYQILGESAMRQLDDAQLNRAGPGSSNSVATVVRHIAGNLKSRFTDFLTTDGEKPWRDRESEFTGKPQSRALLLAHWAEGWSVLIAALDGLSDEHLSRTVTIRGVQLTAIEALHRSLAHTSYHVGQIVYVARSLRGAEWTFLSIPPGGSAAYNQAPTREKPPRP